MKVSRRRVLVVDIIPNLPLIQARTPRRHLFRKNSLTDEHFGPVLERAQQRAQDPQAICVAPVVQNVAEHEDVCRCRLRREEIVFGKEDA